MSGTTVDGTLYTVAVDEFFKSRSTQEGDSPSVDLVFTVRTWGPDLDNSLAVKAAAVATAPTTFDGLFKQDLDIKPLGGGVWRAAVGYGKLEPQDTGGSSFNFDIGTGQEHIVQALGSTVYPSGEITTKNVIGYNGEDVAGVDIYVPTYRFSETHYVDADDVTAAYKATIFSLTGKTNDSDFKDFSAGEVLFLGASGSLRVTGGLARDGLDWEITFSFAARPNKTGLTVGGITGIDKNGWDYLDVRYKEVVDNDNLVKQPKYIQVHQVYETGDFSQLGIGT